MITPRQMVRMAVARLPTPRRGREKPSGYPEAERYEGYQGHGRKADPPAAGYLVELPEEPCDRCKSQYPTRELSGLRCGHRFCKTCLRLHVLDQNFISSPATCPHKRCSQTLTNEEVRKIVGPQAYRFKQMKVDEEAARAIQKEIDAEEKRATHQRRHFQCLMCLEEVAKQDAYELDCGHWHCRDCLQALLRSKISEGLVSETELVCPIPGCRKCLSEVQIQSVLAGSSLWDRFLEFRARDWRPAKREGLLAACPTPDCERFEVGPNEQFVRCPRCAKRFCVRCSGDVHENMTCKEYQAWKVENCKQDKLFHELMAKEDWRRCPRCGVPSQRDGGCNFMRCLSSECKRHSSNCWCYVCGGELVWTDHFTHYPHGAFRNRCFGKPA